MTKNVLLTITGPSLTGKTTLAQDLMKQSDQFETVVTHTTRQPRFGEVNGESYHFVSKEEFKNILKENGFIEYAEVGPAGSKEFYGASKKAAEKVFALNKIPLFVIEPEGAANVYKFATENNYKILQVFLNNDQKVLFTRLLERFQNDKLATPENYTKRLINMIEVEPEKWIKPALDGRARYDIVFDNFHNNQAEVIDTILSRLSALEKKVKYK